MTPTGQCLNSDDSACAGPVHEYTSRSGATTSERCERHQGLHDEIMDAVERGLQERYPGYDSPGSPPPDWFDEANAGERWDDDY